MTTFSGRPNLYTPIHEWPSVNQNFYSQFRRWLRDGGYSDSTIFLSANVKVTADGFRYGGTTYSSLTAVAKAVTKYPSISGPRFFGLDAGSKATGK